MKQYLKLIDSKEFRTQVEAKKWAEDEKKKYKQMGEQPKHDIEFVPTTRYWKVKLYLLV